MSSLFKTERKIITPRHYQVSAEEGLYKWFETEQGNPLIVLPTACHARGTEIMLYDGATKPVEDVAVGDRLMGPDSKPRRVLRLAGGSEMLYRITPKKGEPFVVNEGHILSLQSTNEGKKYPSNTTGNEIFNIRLGDWLKKSKSWRHLYKLRRVGVDFKPRPAVPFDPWALGVLLGDGCVKYGISITSADVEISTDVTAIMEGFGLRTRIANKGKGNKASSYHYVDDQATRSIQNRVTKILRDMGVYGGGAADKFVPDDYKYGSRHTRLEVLAGLLDTDGHCGDNFDYISKSQQLANDVVFIAQSLGLWAVRRPCQKRDQNGCGGTYYRVSISGDIHIIPTRVKRKRAAKKFIRKNPLLTGFTVEPVGVGEFFGFSLDEDHLYLTADFIVHHNTGKSLVIAKFCENALTSWPTTKILILTHVQELIQQNYQELIDLWPSAPAGINSAGVGRREYRAPIIFAGIQSVHKYATKFGPVDIVMIDEAHLIPRDSDTMYRRFLNDLKVINPHVKIVGLTATPYRLDSGRLDHGEGKLFDGIAYEYPILDAVREGYLTPLISKEPNTLLDVTGVGTRGGEFTPSELQAAVDTLDINEAAVTEIVKWGEERKSWLIFGSGVEHCQHLAELVRGKGFSCEVITAETSKTDRAAFIRRFKAGEIRALASMGVLTTGFNATAVDLIAMLRPTKSTGLYVQICGRGMRLHPGKANCLVLDFAGNVARHGPVDAVDPKDPKKGDGEAPTKTCPECKSIVHAAALVCPDCGFEFPPRIVKIEKTATALPVMSSTISKWIPVDDIEFNKHEKLGKPISLRVTYHCAFSTYKEWVCFEHIGFARQKAASWWMRRGNLPVPNTVAEALERIRNGELKTTTEIAIKPAGKFTEVTDAKLAMSGVPPSAAGLETGLGDNRTTQPEDAVLQEQAPRDSTAENSWGYGHDRFDII